MNIPDSQTAPVGHHDVVAICMVKICEVAITYGRDTPLIVKPIIALHICLTCCIYHPHLRTGMHVNEYSEAVSIVARIGDVPRHSQDVPIQHAP